MNKKRILLLISLFLSSSTFALQPVTISGPVPAIAPVYSAGSTHTLTYTITNRVPKSLPVTVGGIFSSITRTLVANDCGMSLPPAVGTIPSSCNIGISITPTQAEIGIRSNQILQIDYQGRTPLKTLISFVPRQSMIYVTNIFINNISECVINLETGVISDCVVFSDPTFSNSPDIVVHPSGRRAYIANNTNNTISECPIQENGMLSPCTAFTGNGTFAGPAGLSINRAGTFLYIANYGNSTISTCSIDNTGKLNQCILSMSGLLNRPDDTIIDPSNTFVYITNFNANTVLRCTVAANGSLSGCIQSGAVFSGPGGITMNPEGTLLYVNNLYSNTVSVCPILPGNSFLGTCTSSNPDGNFNLYFGKNAIYNHSFLFVANGGGGVNNISVCRLNAQGGLVSCPTTDPNSTFDAPQGIALN
jgi:DNA-binding beta-propeller fold protein YncE